MKTYANAVAGRQNGRDFLDSVVDKQLANSAIFNFAGAAQ